MKHPEKYGHKTKITYSKPMSYEYVIFNLSKHFVGVPGFEPGASCSQSRRANRTALHPETINILA